MTRRQALWVGFVALALLGCSAPLDATVTGGWKRAVALIGLLGAASALRTAWLLASAARTVREMPMGIASEALLISGRRAGVERLAVVESEEVFAVCSGLLRPKVVVSSQLTKALGGSLLDAVLVHEARHARCREPLRRAWRSAVADIFLPFPVLRWWAVRRIEDSELAADRAAIARVGVEPVAAALLVVGRSVPRVALAAFEGVAERRAAQLLGERQQARRVPLRVAVGSGAGFGVLSFAALCATGLVG